MLKKLFLLLSLFVGITVSGQENCSNGIDDDGDGYIDCYDSECNGNTDCSDFFYGQPVVNCSMNPTTTAFSLNTIWQSSINVSTRSTMMVGDIDADGTPEVVCHQSAANQLYVLDGQTGAIETTINCPAILDYGNAIAIGDTDDDGLGEIYVLTSDGFLRCFENDGTVKASFTPVNTLFNGEHVPAIADFNFDGTPEIYIGNKIYNALTGALIAAGTGSIGKNPSLPSAFAVAADVLPDSYCANCSGLELICGNTVYAVNIPSATITPIANSLPGSLLDGYTCLADINLDGQLDVVVTSNGTMYVWDPRTGLQLGNTFNIPNTSAGGRANIADYDNDGLPEIGVGGNDRYVVIDVDTATNALSQKWIKTIVDGSQHTTGSVFDFDCDGRAQVAYRDENNLYVWDGETGAVNASIPCGSATRSEFPTIVDVDGDGQVNIVCACAAGNQGGAGKVKAFNSSTNQWVGSRTVMNQHSYFVTNINDDLSIPTQQQNHALLPKINGFLAQSPIYDLNWNSSCIPLADINVTIDSVIYCQKPDSVVLELTLCNTGSKITTPPINISIYNGNPGSGGTLITTITTPTPVYSDSCSSVTISAPYSGTTATWYVYVNDDGSNSANAPQTTFVECDSSNNWDSTAINMPAVLVEITGDTAICKGDSTVLAAIGASSFTWSPANGLSTYTGATVTASPLTTTTYTITGTDTLTGCDNFTIITITVHPNPTAVFGNTTVCQGLPTQFTDTSTTASGTISSWNWFFGDGNALNLLQNPPHVYDSAGNYNAILIVANNFGCKDTLTKPVEVFSIPSASFTHQDVCDGDTIHFSNTSSIHQPAAISSYTWTLGDNSQPVNAADPSHLYTAAGSYNVKLVAISSNGCKDSIPANVNVFDAPVAAFTSGNSCLPDSVEFVNVSANPTMGTLAGWQWNFGDQSPVNTTTWSPGHLYASAGTYPVTLIVYSSNLSCSDTLTDSVSIFPLPVANFSADEVCFSGVTTFHDSSSVLSGTITSWTWHLGDGPALSTAQNPDHTYSNWGFFTCSLIVSSDNGCSDTIAKNILVHPLPDALFETENVCDDSPVTFTDSSSIPGSPTNDVLQYWFWNPGDNSIVDMNQNTSHLYSDTGSYQVQLMVLSDFGCADSVTRTVTVHPNPTVQFTAIDTAGCQPLCISFQSASFVSSGTIAGWSWSFGDNSTSSSQDALHCYYNTTGDVVYFSPSLTATSGDGCVSVVTKDNYISVFPQPAAMFILSPQTIAITNPFISITNSSIFATAWNWNFGDFQTSSTQHPLPHEYADTGTYVITLIASTQYNCKDTAYQTVIIEPDFTFYIPNAFTPNDDGVNDTFIPNGIFINEFEMYIFDRWGNLVYKTDDITKPWDGKVNNGQEMAQKDVYIYLIKVNDLKMNEYKYRGTVTLVR